MQSTQKGPRDFSRSPYAWGVIFYASVIIALVGASERRARLALHEVHVVVRVIQRGFQALLVRPELIAGRCIAMEA